MQQATGPAGGALKPACVHPSHRLIGTPSDSHRIKIASARANGAGGRIIALKALRPTPKPLDGRAPDGQAIQTLFAGLPSNCAGGVLRATAPICSPHMYQYHGSKQAWSDMPLGAGVLNAYCGLLITSMGAPVFSKSLAGRHRHLILVTGSAHADSAISFGTCARGLLRCKTRRQQGATPRLRPSCPWHGQTFP